MRPMRPRSSGPRESTVVQQIREALLGAGWTVVQKLHGSAYQAGLPDLFCFRPPSTVRWVEVKRARGGRLTAAQKVRFAEWESGGLGVWVLTGPQDVVLLSQAPNWREWLSDRVAGLGGAL